MITSKLNDSGIQRERKFEYFGCSIPEDLKSKTEVKCRTANAKVPFIKMKHF